MAARKTATKKLAQNTSNAVKLYPAVKEDGHIGPAFDTLNEALDWADSNEWFEEGAVDVLQWVGTFSKSTSYQEVKE